MYNFETVWKSPWQKSLKPFLTYLGTRDEPSSELVIAYDADGRLVAIERDVALSIQQAKDSHSAIFVSHSDVDAIGWRAEEGHLMFLSLQDQDLDRDTVAGLNLV